jgi:peptide/nickel transport system substrate-binding protein
VTRFPTSDTAVRQAISYYVNRSEAIKTSLQGAFPELTTPLQQGILGYTTSVPQYSFDPARGDQALTADGWKKVGGTWTKNGKPLALVLNSLSTDPEYPLIMQAVQGQLDSQGIKATIVTNPVTPWENLNASGGMSLTVLEFANADPAQMLEWYVPGQYFQKWTRVDNPALSRLLTAAQATTSASLRVADYLQAQKIIMTQAYEIPFHVNEDLLTFSSKISGIEYEGGGDDFFYQAH